eukprot:11899900-Alexandrium_andersonii.AAC.1
MPWANCSAAALAEGSTLVAATADVEPSLAPAAPATARARSPGGLLRDLGDPPPGASAAMAAP